MQEWYKSVYTFCIGYYLSTGNIAELAVPEKTYNLCTYGCIGCVPMCVYIYNSLYVQCCNFGTTCTLLFAQMYVLVV